MVKVRDKYVQAVEDIFDMIFPYMKPAVPITPITPVIERALKSIGDYCVERVREEAANKCDWLSEAHIINLVMKQHKEAFHTKGEGIHKDEDKRINYYRVGFVKDSFTIVVSEDELKVYLDRISSGNIEGITVRQWKQEVSKPAKWWSGMRCPIHETTLNAIDGNSIREDYAVHFECGCKFERKY
jgi:hypothetical protein